MDGVNSCIGGENFRCFNCGSMRFTRPLLTLIGFMLAAWVIIFLVTDLYLVPALRAAQGADAMAKKQLAAISALVLAIILTSLAAIFLLVLRPGRFFLPRKQEPRSRTKYVDAWAEAGQRIEAPKEEEEEE